LQIESTSSTQVESHLFLQQYESAAQIFFTQGSHALASLAPVEHKSWEQLLWPPPSPGPASGGGGGPPSVGPVEPPVAVHRFNLFDHSS
jgi:hypothetical protein